MGKRQMAGVTMPSVNMIIRSHHVSRLGVAPKDARLFMVCDDRWKFMHAEGGFPPMLFDLHNDPQELVDLGRNSDYEDIVNSC